MASYQCCHGRCISDDKVKSVFIFVGFFTTCFNWRHLEPSGFGQSSQCRCYLATFGMNAEVQCSLATSNKLTLKHEHLCQHLVWLYKTLDYRSLCRLMEWQLQFRYIPTDVHRKVFQDKLHSMRLCQTLCNLFLWFDVYCDISHSFGTLSGLLGYFRGQRTWVSCNALIIYNHWSAKQAFSNGH